MPVRTVAAFDFDGTLSSRDNLVPFLRRVAGARRVFRVLLAALPALITGRRDLAKAILLKRTLAGRRASELTEVGTAFADHLARTHLRPDVVERAEWHRERGHELVIVSASLTFFLEPIVRHLRFDGLLATEVEIDADGRCTGRLVGANVRGREKARRLDAWIGDEPATVWAYGNSHSDRALLARADHPVRVGFRRIATPPPPGNPSDGRGGLR